MKKRALCFLFCLLFELKAHYQDIIINGVLLAEGSYACKTRYSVLKNLLDNYTRPFTVLDLGASEGYFSFTIARNYQAVCIMLEGNYAHISNEVTADRLEELCKENTDISTCVLLKKHISRNELKILSECEHFDVVLALNFINHFGSYWQTAAEHILALGDYIIIESPCADNKDSTTQKLLTAIEAYLKAHKAQIIGQVYYKHQQDKKASTLYLIEGTRKIVKRFNWHTRVPNYMLDNITIKSDFHKKTVSYNDTTQAWPQGINMLTYTMLNGVFPSLVLPDVAERFVVSGNTITPVPALLHELVQQIQRDN